VARDPARAVRDRMMGTTMPMCTPTTHMGMMTVMTHTGAVNRV
jgi:hypothetical protein